MSRQRQARRSRWLVVGATAALLLVAGTWLAGPASSTSAQTPAEPPFTVSLSQREDLIDGQPVDVEVTMRSDLAANAVTAYICRPGKEYTAVTQNAGDCPVSVPISASAGDRSFWQLYPYSSGHQARGTIVAGVGTAEWTSTINSDRFSLTCNPTTPCLLVVRASVPGTGGTQQYFDSSTTLTYQDSDPSASCGGPAPGALRSAGADRMLSAWREWTVAECEATPSSPGSATLALIPDEGLAVSDFAKGTRDVVYTAAGTGEPGFTPTTARATVATPVAVNAVVLAAAGGHFTANDPNWPAGLRRPYGDLRLTPQEIAVLLGQGQGHLALTLRDQVLARNPELGAIFPSVDARPPLALSSATAMSLYLTRYLDQIAGAAWTAGPELGFVGRGVTANLGVPESLDEPTFANALSMVSDPTLIDRAAFKRILEIHPGNLGPQWVWTDFATAQRLGMTPVSIQNAAGEWITPTAESLAAAVPTMVRQSNGMLAPNVSTTAAGAYPLTIVEYALAPAEPLYDDACVARTNSQKLLGDWLSFVTGDGQAVLPDGFVPLTPALRTDASAAIAKVGATPTTRCADPGPGPTTTTLPPSTTAPPTTNPPPVDDNDDYSPPGSSPSSPHGGTPPRESTPEDREEGEKAVAAAKIKTPPFGGIAVANEVLPPISLLLVVALTSTTAFLTSGRPLPAAAKTTGRALAGAARATRRRLRLPTSPVRLPNLLTRGPR